MRRLLWMGIVGVVAAAVASAGWAFLRSGSGLQRGAMTRAEAAGKGAEKRAADQGAKAAPAEAELPQQAAKAVADETSHRLGVLEPGQNCEHAFWIRNEGDAPLALERGGTSCNCTMSHLPPGEIPPGSTVPVRVASKIEPKEGPFNHRATILTNDPDRPQIDFYLEGEVRTILAVSQRRVSTYTLADEAPAEQEVLVYSLAWPEFDVDDVKTSMPEATWRVHPAEQVVLDRYKAKSGHILSVQMPPQGDKGYHTLHLDVTAYPAGQREAAHSVQVAFVHEVRSGGTISGPRYQWYDSTLNLGPLFEGEGARDHLVVAIRDKRRPNVEKIESEPAFLKVAMEPLENGREGTQVFRISVEVPKDAPPCNYRTNKGWVRITTDGQVANKIEFDVSFAISRVF